MTLSEALHYAIGMCGFYALALIPALIILAVVGLFITGHPDQNGREGEPGLLAFFHHKTVLRAILSAITKNDSKLKGVVICDSYKVVMNLWHFLFVMSGLTFSSAIPAFAIAWSVNYDFYIRLAYSGVFEPVSQAILIIMCVSLLIMFWSWRNIKADRAIAALGTKMMSHDGYMMQALFRYFPDVDPDSDEAQPLFRYCVNYLRTLYNCFNVRTLKNLGRLEQMIESRFSAKEKEDIMMAAVLEINHQMEEAGDISDLTENELAAKEFLFSHFQTDPETILNGRT